MNFLNLGWVIEIASIQTQALVKNHFIRWNNRVHDYGDAYEKLLKFLVADHLPVIMAQFEGTIAWFWDDEGLAARLTGIYEEHFYAIHA